MTDNGILKRHLNDVHSKQSEWHEHQDGVYHASTLGRCVRNNYLQIVEDHKPEPRAYPHFELGHRLEEVFLDSLKTEYGDRYVKTDVPICIEIDDFKIVGETDPVVIGDNWEFKHLFECKTTSDLRYTRQHAKPEHIVQVHSYMKALDIDKAHIVYVCKKDLDTVTHEIPFQQNIWDRIVEDVTALHNALENEEIPDPVKKGEEDYFCPFSDMCCKNQ